MAFAQAKKEERIIFRQLTEMEIKHELFSSFVRRQVVEKCWRMENGHGE